MRQAPQSAPALQAATTSSRVDAPPVMTALTALSPTPRHKQTIMRTGSSASFPSKVAPPWRIRYT